MTNHYVSTTDTAKFIRQALKKSFPATKFSVRSKSYAGGSSIDVSWTDGPTKHEVEAITSAYAGGGFDGSIDLAYNVETWLNPDGSASLAHCGGTEGSRGSVPEVFGSRKHPDAILVHFMADYVFCQRDYSPEFKASLYDQLREVYGSDFGPETWIHTGHQGRDELYLVAEGFRSLS